MLPGEREQCGRIIGRGSLPRDKFLRRGRLRGQYNETSSQRRARRNRTRSVCVAPHHFHWYSDWAADSRDEFDDAGQSEVATRFRQETRPDRATLGILQITDTREHGLHIHPRIADRHIAEEFAKPAWVAHAAQ